MTKINFSLANSQILCYDYAEKINKGKQMEYIKITEKNFSPYSLGSFVRHQEVYECYRRIDGELKLVPVRFTESWGAEELINMAQHVLDILHDGFGYAAVSEGKVVGFAAAYSNPVGENREYIELSELYVSEEHRNMGIGRKLFTLVAEEAKALGAKKLYISAHSSKESQAAYRHFGCTESAWIYPEKAEAEPCDVQMEYVLK